MLDINEAVEFLRERLHKVFTLGCHYTAPNKPIETPPPPPPSIQSMWERTKECLLEGYDVRHNQDGTPNDSRRNVLSVVLDNTRQALSLEAANTGAGNSANVATLNKVILPVVRRVIPSLIAFEIVGVQPMTGPVSQIHTLRTRYNPIEKFSGFTVPEALKDEVLIKKIKKLNVDVEKFLSTSTDLEGFDTSKLSIQIMKEVVEAKHRKLAARWTFEAAQDAQARRGLDIEAEIMAALAQEVVAELDQELLEFINDSIGIGVATSTFMQCHATPEGTPTFVGDVHAALAILISRQANLIAARTRRGAGNWCVVSPLALSILQSATTSAFARHSQERDNMANIKYAGTLNNAMRVYVNQYAPANEDVLIGYKGNDIDAGVFYTPYVPLTSSGVTIDTATFEPVVSFMTRGGMFALQESPSSLGVAADYFGKVAIECSDASYI